MPNTHDELQKQKLAQSILADCAVKSGGVDVLAKRLGVDENTLLSWLGGSAPAPVEIIQKAVEPFLKKSQ